MHFWFADEKQIDVLRRFQPPDLGKGDLKDEREATSRKDGDSFGATV